MFLLRNPHLSLFAGEEQDEDLISSQSHFHPPPAPLRVFKPLLGYYQICPKETIAVMYDACSF